jgi:hypothetical protein
MQQMDMVHEIRAAKRAHVNWVSHAHALIEGLPLEQGQVPINATECKFGIWYYGHGQALSSLPEFKAIEPVHMALHETYARIFKHLFGHAGEDQPKSWFDRFFGARTEAPEDHHEAARQLFPDLKRHSEVVVGYLEKLERCVVEMNAVEFDRVAAQA